MKKKNLPEERQLTLRKNPLGGDGKNYISVFRAAKYSTQHFISRFIFRSFKLVANVTTTLKYHQTPLVFSASYLVQNKYNYPIKCKWTQHISATYLTLEFNNNFLLTMENEETHCRITISKFTLPCS